MATGASDKIGILVIRAWLEGPDQRLIVRIMKTSDVANQSVTVTVAATTEDVSARSAHGSRRFAVPGRWPKYLTGRPVPRHQYEFGAARRWRSLRTPGVTMT